MARCARRSRFRFTGGCMRSSRFITFVAPVLVAGAACTDSSSPNMAPVSISFSAQAPAASAALGDIIVTSGTNTLVITKAQVVVRRIKLTESTATQCSDDDTNDDDSEETVAGPMLVDLPLPTAAVQSVPASIPAGTYSEIEFKIHKPG